MGRARVKCTHTVKVVLKEAMAILGESKAIQIVHGESVNNDFSNRNFEDSKKSIITIRKTKTIQ